MELSQRKGLRLQTGNLPIPPDFNDYLLNFYCSYALPDALRLPVEVQKGWDDFERWYTSFKRHKHTVAATLREQKISDRMIFVIDQRFGKVKEYELKDDYALAYEACHVPSEFETIAKLTGISGDRLKKVLEELIEAKLLLSIEGRYIALALREKELLIGNYLRTQLRAN